MNEADGERIRILAELAERVWAEYGLNTADEDRRAAEASAARSAAVSEEQLLARGLTAERRREAAQFSAWLRDTERRRRTAQIAEGLKFFGTFSTETLIAFDRDLRSDGPFAVAMRISLRGGTESLVRDIESKFTGERFIRDFLAFQPYNYEIILDAYKALGLTAPVGLTDFAAEGHSLRAVEEVLLIGEALRQVQRHRQHGLVIGTGYSAGDEMHERCKHLQHLTPHFARWILTESPSDETLDQKLFVARGGVFGLTLEGLSSDGFLSELRHHRDRRKC